MNDAGFGASAISGRDRSYSFRLDAVVIILILAGAAGVLAFAWVGYLGSDDVTYAVGAYGWLQQFPYVGGHGTIRYLITVPIAISFALFGDGEFQLVLPTIVYFAALILLTYGFVAHLLDRVTALLAAILMATLPLLAVQATTASADITEMTFVAASVWLYCLAATSRHPLALLLGAGACAGLAWLTRETTVALVLFYGLAFLAGYHIKRWQYFVIGAGFLAVWSCELLYLWVMTGDPLYRVNISLHHDSTVTRAYDSAGNLFVHPAINPLLMLLVNQEFAAFFWVAIPVCIALAAGRSMAPEARKVALLWIWVGLVWFLFFAVNSSLLPLNPRYATPTAYGAVIATAVFLRHLLCRGRIWTVGILVAGLLTTNLAAIHVENRDYMFGERALTQFVREQNRPVRTDPDTAHRALQLLEWAHSERLVEGGEPRQGELYLYNPIRAGFSSRLVKPEDASKFLPRAGWEVVWSVQPRPKLIGRALQSIGLDRAIPASLMRRLYLPHPGVTVYRVTG